MRGYVDTEFANLSSSEIKNGDGTNNIQVTQLSQQNTLNSVADGAITQAKLSFDPADDATALAIALG